MPRGRKYHAFVSKLRAQTRSPAVGGWVLAASILGSGMAFIDSTVVSVALPVLQKDLGASAASVQWIVEAYALFLSSLVLVGGALADRMGRRRIFVLGTVIFAAASLACGLAPGVHWLILARGIQGVGAALLVPSSLAMLGSAFSEEERGRAVGTWSALTSVAGAVGPALGGWLVQAVSWRAVFLINIPIAMTVVFIALRKVPETRNSAAAPLDLGGACLATVGLGLLVFGLIEVPTAGGRDPRVWGSVVAGIASLVAFVLLERRLRHPMVPVTLFRNRAFTSANLLTLFLYAALTAIFFFLPFVLIQARGYSPAAAGAAMLPLIILISALSRTAGGIADRIGPRIPLTVGPLVAAIGFALFGLLPGEGSYAVTVLPALLVVGLGMAVTIAPLTTTVLNSVGRDDQGAAAGINNAVARVASLLAIAVFGILAARTFNRELDRRLDAGAVSPRTRELLDPERARLGAATAPRESSPSESRAIAQGVAAALEKAFRLVGFAGAALALLAAACGAMQRPLAARTPA